MVAVPHICILGWRPKSLITTLPAISRSFPNSKLLICAQPQGASEIRDIINALGADAEIFTPQEADARFGAHDLGADPPIGRKRNLLQLASMALNPNAPVIMMDDDVRPDGQTAALFERAFKEYDLVQGKYRLSVANKIYVMVHAFGYLELGPSSYDFEPKISNALGGLVEDSAPETGVSGVTGGLVGLGPTLIGRVPFAPTRYLFDDHFFEFSSRHIRGSLRFMDGRTPPSIIPWADHLTPRGPPTKMVDDYILYVKAAVVEKYHYYKTCGALPYIVEGRHKLLPTPVFDLDAVQRRTYQEAAVEKFRAAAAHYLQTYTDKILCEQLRRITNFTPKTFELSMAELESQWEIYSKERAWFEEAVKKTRHLG